MKGLLVFILVVASGLCLWLGGFLIGKNSVPKLDEIDHVLALTDHYVTDDNGGVYLAPAVSDEGIYTTIFRDGKWYYLIEKKGASNGTELGISRANG